MQSLPYPTKFMTFGGAWVAPFYDQTGTKGIIILKHSGCPMSKRKDTLFVFPFYYVRCNDVISAASDAKRSIIFR